MTNPCCFCIVDGLSAGAPKIAAQPVNNLFMFTMATVNNNVPIHSLSTGYRLARLSSVLSFECLDPHVLPLCNTKSVVTKTYVLNFLVNIRKYSVHTFIFILFNYTSDII